MSRHYIFIITIIFVARLGFSLGISSPQDSLRTISKEGARYIEYVVAPGETVYRISSTYNISISRLMEVNPELENGLKSGQLILIPLAEVVHTPVVSKQGSEFDDPDLNVHTVAPGETLYSLSKKYDVSVGDLLKWNGMELRAGQQLVVGYKSQGESAPEIEEEDEEEEDAPEAATLTKPEEEKPKRERAEPTKADVHIYTSTDLKGDEYRVYDYDTNMKQVLIVPFDPHLYFSDADDEIAEVSRIPRIKVREVFRRRLNVLLAPRGYESIYLLGGKSKDTLSDLNKIYGSVTYNYQDVLYSDAYMKTLADEEEEKEPTASSADEKVKDWIKKTRDKLTDPQNDEQAHREKFKGKYFGVRVTDPRFFDYFDRKYSIDYYIFINQFEVITDYEHCLDRSVGNYKRYFIAHFSIFDKAGNQIAGNKFRVDYDSNSNDIHKICGDNMIKIADRVLRELPPPDREY